MELIVNKDKKFKIIQFTDLHFGDLPWNENDIRTKEAMVNIVNEIKPDLLVFTGDNIWTDGVKHYKKSYEDFIEVVNNLNLPCAITYGNHDAEDQMTREMLNNYAKLYKNHVEKENLFYTNNRENYHFAIKNIDKKEILRIFMIDSGNKDDNNISQYAPLYMGQGDYVAKYSSEVENSMVFMHIPIPEYWLGLDKIETGICKETNAIISSSTYQYGFYSNVLLNGKIRGIYAGHDHDNNFTFKLNGIELGYGNVSGYNCYGELKRGVRVFEIDDTGSYTTYIKTYNDEK